MTDSIVMEHQPEITPRTRTLLLAIRQALIIALGAIEDYMGVSRSIEPKHRK